MSTSTYDIKLTCGYQNTDATRQYKFTGVDSVSAATETVRAKVKAINESLAGGTDGGLKDFFRSDNFNAQESIGALSEITQAVIDNRVETVIIERGGSNG